MKLPAVELAEPCDLQGAVVGVSAESLAGLSPSEVVARIGRTSQRSVIVVFDGPGRTVASRLDEDGLARRRLIRALAEAEIPFLVAPALAAAELAFMHGENLISHVFGAEETWLWADVPVILDFFTAQPLMVRRSTVLAQLHLSQASFVELFVGLGHSAVTAAAFPLLEGSAYNANLDTGLRLAAQLAVQLGGPAADPAQPAVSLYRAALALQDPAYLAQYQRALTFVRRQPVLHVDGKLGLWDDHQLPKDLTDVIGCQISPLMHFYISEGLLGPELVRGMVWYKITGKASPSRADAKEEQLQGALSPLRQQAYSLLTSTAHRYFQMREIVVQIPGAKNLQKAVVPTPPPFTEPATPASVVADAVSRLQDEVNLKDTLPIDLAAAFAARTVSDPSAAHIQVVALVFRQFVEAAVYWLLVNHEVDVDMRRVVLALPF